MWTALLVLGYSVLQAPLQMTPVAGIELHDYPRDFVFRWSQFHDMQTTHFNFEWMGDQPGRWRVWAVAGFVESEKSPWRDFTFKTGGQSTPPKAPEPVTPALNEM